MSKLFRALLLLGSVLSSAVRADECPGLGGTYRKISGDEPASRVLVIQDQCRSVTFLYDNEQRGFTSASPRFLVDGAWHPSASRAEYRAVFKYDQLRVTWRSEAHDVKADGFAWGVDEYGNLGQSVPHPDGKSQLTTYFEPITHHHSPTRDVKIRGDRGDWWLASGPDRVRVIPLLEGIRQVLKRLDGRRAYTCRMTSERIHARENTGEVVFDLSACRLD